MKTEERTVNDQSRLLEPLDNFVKQWQLVFDARRSHSISLQLYCSYAIQSSEKKELNRKVNISSINQSIERPTHNVPKAMNIKAFKFNQ